MKLYTELNEAIPAYKYLDDAEPVPNGYREATQEELDAYRAVNLSYRLTGATKDSVKTPLEVDYDLYGLYKKRYFVAGELTKIEYYCNYDPNTYTYSDLAVKETRTYVRNPEGYVLYRVLDIEWYLEDGSIGATKQTTKYYDLLQSMEEGIRKRSNIISQVKADLLMELVTINQYSITNAEDEARPLLNEQATNIGLYREGDTQPIKDSLAVSTIPLLDYIKSGDVITLRQWILDTI